MRKTILAQEMYFPKPNTKHDSEFGSWVCKVLGTRAPRSIQEYNLTTETEIRTLTKPLMREISSSVLVAISRLKVASDPWDF